MGPPLVGLCELTSSLYINPEFGLGNLLLNLHRSKKQSYVHIRAEVAQWLNTLCYSVPITSKMPLWVSAPGELYVELWLTCALTQAGIREAKNFTVL